MKYIHYICSTCIFLTIAVEDSLSWISLGNLRAYNQNDVHGRILSNRPWHSKYARLQMSSTDLSAINGPDRVQKFLEDCVLLGSLRFIARNNGVILEAVGEYDKVKYKDTADGCLASLISDDKSFECHVNLNKVGRIEMTTKEKDTDSGSRTLYLIRLYDFEGSTLLTKLLHYDGEYEEGAVEWWLKMREVFGESQIISS